MATPFIIFIRAIGLYLLFTIPALAIPLFYVYSAFLALAFGCMAGFIFISAYLFIAKASISFIIKRNLLFFFVLAAVTIAFLSMPYTGVTGEMWGFNLFLVFPGIAVIAGWSSLFLSRKEIRAELDPEATDLQLIIK